MKRKISEMEKQAREDLALIHEVKKFGRDIEIREVALDMATSRQLLFYEAMFSEDKIGAKTTVRKYEFKVLVKETKEG